MSALHARWSEERALVLEEMRRTVRFFKYNQHWWLLEGERREAVGLDGAAAYARK